MEYIQMAITIAIALGGLAIGYGIMKGKVRELELRIAVSENRLNSHSDRLRGAENTQASLCKSIEHLDDTIDSFTESVANLSVSVGDLATRMAVQEDRNERD